MTRLRRPSATTAGAISASAALCFALVGGSVSPALAATTPTPSTSRGTTVAAAPSRDQAATPTTSAASAAKPGAVPTPAPTPAPAPITPVVTGITKHLGNTASVRTAALTGTHLGHVARVLVGGVVAADLTLVGSKRVTFLIGTAPNFQATTVPISVVTDTGVTLPTTLSYSWKVRTKRDREMAYAGVNWNATKNARFGYLPGSDCTNFVSQLLLARGWLQSAQWWNTYSTTRTWSATWASVTAMSDWLGTRPDLATHLLYRDRNQAVVGDIIQINWDGVGAGKLWEHSAVVSRVDIEPDGTHDIYYTAHSTNRLYGGSLYWLVKGYKHIRIQFWHLNT